MARLRVKELAEQQGLNISQLQLKTGVAMGTMRRYWYSTKDGSAHGPAIELVDLTTLAAIARAIGVRATDLINEDELGNSLPMLLAA
jgi:transcriptional regulator with XRE-family HTH domain